MTEETKAEKFVRLRDSRLPKILEAIGILGNLSSKKNYDYTEAEARDVIAALREKVDEVAAAFGVAADAPAAPQAPFAAAEAPAADLPAHLVDLTKLRKSIREVDGRLLRVDPDSWTDLDLIHVGPKLGLALEASMEGDSKVAVAMLLEVLAT
ncbi:hypothetical protein [Defluviimonas salinarum]|uniref:Uncharacterized protein n=1 Tax=Defluviimonas salinarum TaxID=2992147 RepID=A0ABT3J5N1_9RHOB|nr:hypothetical protein [Defluviimonas salinarum]MCW3783002.1 hypothetical protein [Defluviimonas salinarum]